jgi:hypothetical protein
MSSRSSFKLLWARGDALLLTEQGMNHGSAVQLEAWCFNFVELYRVRSVLTQNKVLKIGKSTLLV